MPFIFTEPESPQQFWAHNAVKGKKGFQPTNRGELSLAEASDRWIGAATGAGAHEIRASIAASEPNAEAEALLKGLAKQPDGNAPTLYRGVIASQAALAAIGVTVTRTERTEWMKSMGGNRLDEHGNLVPETRKMIPYKIQTLEGSAAEPGKQFDLNLASFSSSEPVARHFAAGTDFARPVPGGVAVVFRVEGATALKMTGKSEYATRTLEKEWVTGGRFELTGARVTSGRSREPVTGSGETLRYLEVSVRQVAILGRP